MEPIDFSFLPQAEVRNYQLNCPGAKGYLKTSIFQTDSTLLFKAAFHVEVKKLVVEFIKPIDFEAQATWQKTSSEDRAYYYAEKTNGELGYEYWNEGGRIVWKKGFDGGQIDTKFEAWDLLTSSYLLRRDYDEPMLLSYQALIGSKQEFVSMIQEEDYYTLASPHTKWNDNVKISYGQTGALRSIVFDKRFLPKISLVARS